MAKQLQLRKGTATEHNTFTGALGEVTVDTTNKTLRVHDGVTAGGTPLINASAAVTPKNVADMISSNIVVKSGTIFDGLTIPLPEGFTEAQCKWMVSPSDTTLCNLGANNQGGDFFQLKCFTTGRVVTAQISFYNTTTGNSNTYDKSYSANYIIIGVK